LVTFIFVGCSVNKPEVKSDIITKIQPKISSSSWKIYQVQNGETAIGVALKHGMTFSQLVNLNNLNPPYELLRDQKLKVIEIAIKARPAKISKIVELKPIWPIKGKVISKFGEQENGRHNDGINIAALNGEVQATAPGSIAYIGNEIGSYGNLIIIQHAGDWFSSYGHLSEIKVQKGDLVKAGDIIGIVDNSLLYFGLRKGITPVDPVKYLSGIKRMKKGKINE